MPSLAAAPPVPATPTSTSTSNLHLSPAALSALSPDPYLLAHLTHTPPTRPSSRSPSTFRATSIHTSSLAHCLGSAVVRQGETAVVCGITPEILLARDVADPPRHLHARKRRKGEIVDPVEVGLETDAVASLGLLVPNIDLSTGCAPTHLPGSAPTAAAQSLAQRLHRLLLSTSLVPLSALEIWRPKRDLDNGSTQVEDEDDDEERQTEEVVAYFVLHINMTVLSLSGSRSLAAVASLAMLAALRDLRLPAARWDEEREAVICSDIASRASGLNLRAFPVMSCFAVFEGSEGGKPRRWVLADPDALEESVCREWVDVVVDCRDGTRVLGLEKSGGRSVGVSDVKELVGLAEGRWHEVAALLPATREGGSK